MRFLLRSSIVLLSVLFIVGCFQATPDKKLVAQQCEKMINEKLRFEGKEVRTIDALKEGNGLVILSVKYGFANTSYNEKSVYCGSNNSVTAYNQKLSELTSVLEL